MTPQTSRPFGNARIQVLAAIGTKKGVGKTTMLANLGGLLADINARVLLVDADTQPSLSNYYALTHEAPAGLFEVMTRGNVEADCVSHTSIPGLDLIKSNDRGGELQNWLRNRFDRRTRLGAALSNSVVRGQYDVVLIDTQCAIGPLQTAAAFAADALLSPLPPDSASVREFRKGTLAVLKRLERSESTSVLPPIKAVVSRFDYSTRDANGLLREVTEEFREMNQVSILSTIVPNSAAYRDAFTLRTPVHRHNKTSDGRMPSANEMMHRLMWELFPQFHGMFAKGPRGEPGFVFLEQ